MAVFVEKSGILFVMYAVHACLPFNRPLEEKRDGKKRKKSLHVFTYLLYYSRTHKGIMGSRALSHDSIFILETGQEPARPVRVFSQENISDRIRALQVIYTTWGFFQRQGVECLSRLDDFLDSICG